MKFLFASAMLAAIASPASANLPSAPSLKPDKIHASSIVSTHDARILREAMRAADRGEWASVSRLQKLARDEDVARLILWRRASAGPPGMGFDELADAIETLQGWPSQTAMRRRAEEIIDLSAVSAGDRINWLTANGGPITGAGKLALAQAYKRLGQIDDANAAAREAWRDNSFDRDVKFALIADFGDVFTQDDHRARADFLMWTNQRSEARAMKPYLTADWRALVDARTALAASSRGVDAKIDAVPEALQDNPGLMYERARWRRKRGNQDGATPLLKSIDGADVPAAGRERLWGERSIAMRDSLKDREYADAYALAAPHGMDSGVDFAEAEWAAGWIALRFRDDAPRATDHFRTLDEGVGSSISKARARYWSGRSLEAAGDAEAANAAYAAAAEHEYVFYGQLGAQRTGGGSIALQDAEPPTEEDREAFEARPLVKALRLIGETGDASSFRRFAYHIDDQLETPQQYLLLSELAGEYQYPDIGVRGAKAGLARGIVAPDAAFPLVDYSLLREPRVERPLMLALSRQESEMNPRAISHANAHGLMQFLPTTARREARMQGLPFRTSWLTDDPGYNMTLGGAHLDTLLRRFNGSYVMTAAAYNAGPTRINRWIRDYGDPRAGEIDTLDWIELIPFSETRNYVQRVIENTQVYRHRMSGEPAEIRTAEDVERGKFR
ncbi:MAG: lytic transglycosylase domain-containing protein [Pseudomonadota bacterium]